LIAWRRTAPQASALHGQTLDRENAPWLASPHHPKHGIQAMPVRSLAAAAALSVALAVPGAAQIYDGTYNGDQCGLGYRNELALDIYWPQLTFYESRCEVTARTPVAGLYDTFVYTATCRGEGQTWTRSFLLANEMSGGVALIEDGYAEIFHYCGQ
jgi:hypothetical protein